MLTPMTDETKSRLLSAGFAVPGMDVPPRRVIEECTKDAPCEFDLDVALEMAGSLALTPGPVLLLCILAFSIGEQAFGSEDLESSNRPISSSNTGGSSGDVGSEEGRLAINNLDTGGGSSSTADEPTSGDSGGGEGWLERLAARSRERRLARLRDLASRLAPVEGWTGWKLVSEEGLPTLDAFVFLAIAVAAQIFALDALFAPVRDAFS